MPISKKQKERLTQRVLELLKGCSGSLPSTRELSRRWNLSQSAISQVTRELVSTGVLVHQGRNLWPAGSVPDRNQSERPSGKRDFLCNVLKQQIEIGALMTGQSLPKSAFLTARYRISGHTVARALQMLFRMGYISKRGRSWVVGSNDSRVDDRQPAMHYVIAVLLHGWQCWEGMLSDRTSPFMHRFLFEIQASGTELKYGLMQEQSEGGILHPAGLDKVQEALRELGDRHLGTLIMSPKSPLPGLRDWVEALLRFRKPIVWFNHGGAPSLGVHHPLLTQLRWNEEAAIAEAAQYLVENGHRRIAYFARGNKVRWIHHRYRRLQFHLAGLAPDASLISANHAAFSAAWVGDRSLRDRITALLKSEISGLSLDMPRTMDRIRALALTSEFPDDLGHLAKAEAGAGKLQANREKVHRLPILFNNLPLVVYVLEWLRPTALVVPNDLNARYVISILRNLPTTETGDLSVLSFDNYASKADVPVDTVDFGMGHLGFIAYHRIAGAISVTRGRRGIVDSKPFISVRGSVRRVPSIRPAQVPVPKWPHRA